MARQPHFSGLVDRIDAWLPQTQCTRCGYPRCRAYADAIARGATGINQCPPGGTTTITALAGLLRVSAKPLDPDCGAHAPRTRAVIDETCCIGCRKCLDVCPVDAIVGAHKLMHTVIAAECTGCGLCLPPCPVDCIAMISVPAVAVSGATWPEYTPEETNRWRLRAGRRLIRDRERGNRRVSSGRARREATPRLTDKSSEEIQVEIRAAVSRVKAKRARDLRRPQKMRARFSWT